VILVFFLIFLTPAVVHFYTSKRSYGIFLSVSVGFVAVFFYFGLFSVLGRYTSVPFNPVVASCGFIIFLALLAKFFAVPVSDFSKRTLRWEMVSCLGLAAASVCHLLIWNSAMKFGAIIPNHDVFNHTAWVGNIARFHSLSPALAYSNPSTGSGLPSNLYPFSLHALCAYVVELTHVQPSVVVITFTKILIIIFWPLGVFNLARAAGLKSFLGPIAAAVSTVALYNFPYTTLGWGGVAMVAGLVVLVHFVSISLVLIPDGGIPLLIAVVISMFTLLVLHTSEAFIYPIMLTVLGVPFMMRHNGRKSVAIPLLLMCVLVFIFPWIDKWIGPGFISNLAQVSVTGSGTMYQGVGQIIMLSAGMEFHTIWVPIILLSGIFAISFLPTRRNILHFYLLVLIGAFITSQISNKPWSGLGFAFTPWYRQYERMGYFLVPAVALLCGVAFEFLETLKLRLHQKFAQMCKIGFAVMLIITILGTSWSRTARVFSILVSEHSPLSKNDLLAPSQVKKLREIDTPILASFDSGIGYWANDYNMKVLGSPFLGNGLLTARESLLDTVSDVGRSKETRELLQSINISYIATNNRTMNGAPRPDPSLVEKSHNFDVFWKGDTVTVWKLRPVVSQLVGDFSTPFSTSEHPSMEWVLNKDMTFHITNMETVDHDIEISFYVSQNTCGTTQSISLWNGQVLKMTRKLPSQIFSSEDTNSFQETGLVKLQMRLSPREELIAPLTFNSKYCLFPQTGAIIYGAVSPVSVKLLK